MKMIDENALTEDTNTVISQNSHLSSKTANNEKDKKGRSKSK